MNQSDAFLSPPTSWREKLAQLMFVRIGSNLPPVRKVEQDAERIGELLADCPIGGLIVFNGDYHETPDTLARLQEISTQPLLVSSDIERGVGQQLHGPELFPHALAFDALGEEAEQVVNEFARLTAIEARSKGLHIAFAPVADVNVDPRNPIIATRAFGDDPERVAQLVEAYVQGCRAGGLLCAAKHFPGHGNTHGDSHHELPMVAATREEMERCELVPFAAAVKAGVPLVMSAHVRYPAWDDSNLPATLSSAALIDLLRNQLGFQGAAISDSLLMDGVKSQCKNEGELAVKALLAGIDILLDVAEPQSTLTALEQAFESGELPEDRVEQAFARLWQLKEAAFKPSEPVATKVLEQQVSTLAQQVAAKSISVVSQQKGLLPLTPNKSMSAVLVRPYQSHLDPVEQPMGDAVRSRHPECNYYELGPQSPPEDYQRVLSEVAQVEQLLIAIIVKPAAWHAFGLLDEQAKFVTKLIDQQDCVLASLGTPEALHQFDSAAVQLCTFSDVPVSQRALAEFLLTDLK